MDENDILLVKRLKNREEKAYVFLFEQYYNRLYRFAANYLRGTSCYRCTVKR